jgi:hypothetical protein
MSKRLEELAFRALLETLQRYSSNEAAVDDSVMVEANFASTDEESVYMDVLEVLLQSYTSIQPRILGTAQFLEY